MVEQPPTAEEQWRITRRLRSHTVWLTLLYVGLILLMARAYA